MRNPYAAAAGSAAPPAAATHLPLSELNRASAKAGGSWLVTACRPFEDKYEYTWQSKPRQGTNLVVTLVSTDDRSQYCQAHFKKTSKNGVKYEQTKNAIKHGARFMMSKVGFVEDAKLQYVSCPLKVVVDLSSTTMDRLGEPPDSAVQPAPTATIAGSAGLAGNQFFDVTGLIQEATDVQQHANNRSSFVVKIYDGSLDLGTQKVKVMPLRIYFDTTESVLNGLAPETKGSSGSTDANNAGQPMSGERMKALADEHLQSKTAMSFFCISGAQDDAGKFSFRSTRHTFITGAVGTKAEMMNGAAELHNLQADDTVVFELQTATSASRDWSLEPGRETQCGLLASFARNATGVPELDDGETVWQCNWVRMTEPSEGQNIKNQFNNLWLQLTSRDTTGPVVLYITEKQS